jgi:hypothetical protein
VLSRGCLNDRITFQFLHVFTFHNWDHVEQVALSTGDAFVRLKDAYDVLSRPDRAVTYTRRATQAEAPCDSLLASSTGPWH